MLRKLYLGLLKKFRPFLSPSNFLKIYHEYYTGKKLDLDAPKEFNEKIQWLKLNYQRPILTKLVDKYEVRAYVSDKIGTQYLNELYGVYEKAADVNFDILPEQYVIKGTHGYNQHLIVKDNRDLNRRKARLKFIKWLNQNQYYRGGMEWAYRDAPPRLIAEAYLEEEGKAAPTDYKLYCFNGQVHLAQVDLDRGGDHRKGYFTPGWEYVPMQQGKVRSDLQMDSPEALEEMIRLAEVLAADLPFVRVDFYYIKERIIFGEMTLYPGDGRQDFYPQHYNRYFGDLLKLPSRKIREKDNG